MKYPQRRTVSISTKAAQKGKCIVVLLWSVILNTLAKIRNDTWQYSLLKSTQSLINCRAEFLPYSSRQDLSPMECLIFWAHSEEHFHYDLQTPSCQSLTALPIAALSFLAYFSWSMPLRLKSARIHRSSHRLVKPNQLMAQKTILPSDPSL